MTPVNGKSAPQLINIMVEVSRTPGSKNLEIACIPEIIDVKRVSILNFQMTADSNPAFMFKDEIDKVPDDMNQLSKPTVSADGRMLTVSDINKWEGNINVTFHVFDENKQAHPFDPQIRNEP